MFHWNQSQTQEMFTSIAIPQLCGPRQMIDPVSLPYFTYEEPLIQDTMS